MKMLADIDNLDDYLRTFGRSLGKRAAEILNPLHVPGVTPLPDFAPEVAFNPNREPFEAQAHVIAGAVALLDNTTGGFIVGETGTGKTLIGMLSFHKHARGKPYRAIVLCPDHLIAKWARELEETIPAARVRTFSRWHEFIELMDKGDDEVTDTRNGSAKLSREDVPVSVGHRDQTGRFHHVKDQNGKTVKIVDLHAEGLNFDIRDAKPGAELQRVVDAIARGIAPEPLVEMRPETVSPRSGRLVRRRTFWKRPVGPEWYILGRNQSKFAPTKVPIVDPVPNPLLGVVGYGSPLGGLSSRWVAVGEEDKKDENGQRVRDKWGGVIRKPVYKRAFICPSCGKFPTDKNGDPVSEAEIRRQSLTCDGLFLQEIPSQSKMKDGEKPKNFERIYSLARGEHFLSSRMAELKEGREVKTGGREFVTRECKTPLWQWTRKPYRWPPAWFVNRKLQGLFDYLVVDEVHEQKADGSAQANAFGSIAGSTRKILALTGTLIGGYSSDIFPLMVRLGFRSIFEEGFEWRKPMPFAEKYGIIKVITTTKYGAESMASVVKLNKSMSVRSEEGKPSKQAKIAPGIMPSLYGRHLLGRAIFLSLEAMDDGLPMLIEYAGGPEDMRSDNADFDAEYRANWFPTGVQMDDEVRQEYHRVESTLEFAVRELVKTGSMKLLGSYLHTCLAYPDKPYGWTLPEKVEQAIKNAEATGEIIDRDDVKSVGYWNVPGSIRLSDWVGVVTPADCDEDVIRPKEQALIDICVHHKKAGNQCWVYLQMTNTRDIQPRLKRLLEAQGLRVCILYSKKVPLKEREAWIEANGHLYDVIISFPKLVSTGLDLFGRTHNFSTLIFYECGYSLFDLRQASRRGWRIGQDKTCFVYYLHYLDTMQARGMELMSRKMEAAMAIDGDYSAEGLVAMAGGNGGSDQLALVKSLSANMDPADMQRNWSRTKGGKKSMRGRITPLVPDDFMDAVFDAMDDVDVAGHDGMDGMDDVDWGDTFDDEWSVPSQPALPAPTSAHGADAIECMGAEPEEETESDLDERAKLVKSVFAQLDELGINFDDL